MQQKKILIVDADAASRNFIARKLQEQKFEILEAASGKEGLIITWRDRPDVVIVDPVLPDIRGEEFATRLRQDLRTDQVPLVALSSDHNPERVKSCREAGFNDYVIKSGQAVPTLSDILGRLFGVAVEAMKQGGMLVVFLSAKGGTGTSSVCANLAMNALEQNPEAKLAVVDLVLPIGSISNIVGYEGEQNIVRVAEMAESETTSAYFRSELPEMGIWRFNLLAGSPDPELSNQLKIGRIWDIITTLKSSYDYVFVDNGRSLSKITLPLIQHADLIVLLISTDVSTLSVTKTMMEYLKSKGVHSDSIYAILNRHAGPEGLSKTEVERELGIKVHAAIPYLDANFAFANSQHEPFTLKFPRVTASIVFHDSAREVIAMAQKMRSK